MGGAEAEKELAHQEQQLWYPTEARIQTGGGAAGSRQQQWWSKTLPMRVVVRGKFFFCSGF